MKNLCYSVCFALIGCIGDPIVENDPVVDSPSSTTMLVTQATEAAPDPVHYSSLSVEHIYGETFGYHVGEFDLVSCEDITMVQVWCLEDISETWYQVWDLKIKAGVVMFQCPEPGGRWRAVVLH
jgi:hypothetical protein